MTLPKTSTLISSIKSAKSYSSYGYEIAGISHREKTLRKSLPYIIDESLLTEMLEIFSPSGEEAVFIAWIINYVRELQKNDLESNYFIREHIEKTYVKNQDTLTNLYITKYPKDYTEQQIEDSIYPCLVAHTDEAHWDIEDRKIFKEVIIPLSDIKDDSSFSKGNLVAYSKDHYEEYERCGLSADDKVGVYACLHALKELPRVKIALFASEEIGMVGSNLADLTFFNNCSFVIQLDRRGDSDLCTKTNGVVVASRAFEDLLISVCEPYGYDIAIGMATDVGELKIIGLDKSAVNMSCGYKNEHTSAEIINLDDMNVAVNLALMICRKGVLDVAEQDQECYTHINTSALSSYKKQLNNNSYKSDWDTYDDWNDKPYEEDKKKPWEKVKNKSYDGVGNKRTDKGSYKGTSNLPFVYSAAEIEDVIEETIEEQTFREFILDAPILYPNNIQLSSLEESVRLIDDVYFNVLLATHLEKRSSCNFTEAIILDKIDKILAREVSRRVIRDNNI